MIPLLKPRNTSGNIIKNCISYYKISSSPSQNVELPFISVMPIQYAGQFAIITLSGRIKKRNKYYVSIFIYLVANSIHLEIVHNLTTESTLYCNVQNKSKLRI